MGTIVTTDVANGQVTDASVINSNFTAVKTVVNGGLTNGNIDNAADIDISKLADYPTDGTKVLYGDGTWGTLPGAATIGYGTTLPASPSDGQESILVDSVSAPTYVWRFRYNSSSASTYKWEFVGGAPRVVESTTNNTTTSASYADPANNVSFTVPRAGDYVVTLAASYNNGSSGTTQIALKRGTSTTVDADSICWSSGGNNGTNGVLSRTFLVTALSASDIVKMQFKCSAGTVNNPFRELVIVPSRVI